MKPDPSFVDAVRRSFATPGPAPDPDACPATDRIWAASHGELDAGATGEVVDHLHACPSCAAEWRAAAPAVEESTAATSSPAGRRSPPVAWLALAATLIVAVGLVFLLRPGATFEAPAFRADQEPGIRSLIPEGAALPRDRFLLRWEPVEDDALYAVQVDRQDLTPVHDARDLGVSELLVPEEALQDVPAGATLVWRVEAHLVDGTRVRSGAFLVRVR
jgi:hypothetical protein